MRATFAGKQRIANEPSSSVSEIDGKLRGYDAPKLRGGIMLENGLVCPCCKRRRLVREKHWVGGSGWRELVACDACGYWEEI